ncbi:MAG: T9SS type A sorting domain-containing protein [Saprospiraceae bacterium]
MKKYILFAVLTVIAHRAYTQKEDYQWLVGGAGNSIDTLYSSAIMDFNNDSLSVHVKLDNSRFVRSNSSICDSTGKLWCWTNGKQIYNAQDELIEGGEDLTPGSFMAGVSASQAMLLLPLPGSPSKIVMVSGNLIHYLFEGFYTSGCSPLYYSLIDMNENSGLGKVVEIKTPLETDTLMFGGYTAVRHANGRDWWVTVYHRDENKYYQFLLDPKGIQFHHVQFINKSPYGAAQSVYSPDGKWYVNYTWPGTIPIDDYSTFDLYKFNRCTGIFSNYLNRSYGHPGAPGGAAFSADSRFLYVSFWNKIYQYDLHASNIIGSETLVAEYDGFVDERGYPTRFYQMQLAPDNKIYISVSNYNSRYMHVIEKPAEQGLACNVQQRGVSLPAYNNWVVPNVPFYRLNAEVGSPCDSLAASVFEPNSPAIRLQPNPTSGQISAIFPETMREDGQITLFDATGRKVSTVNFTGESRVELDLSALPDGLYSVRVQVGREGLMRKIVVAKN